MSGVPHSLCADFSILYEDDSLLVLDKPAPLLVHPTRPDGEPTLWHGLQELLMYELATGGQISFVNRLDRETSGITLIAKTTYAASELGKAMQERRFKKTYAALVVGNPLWDYALCEEAICRMEDVYPEQTLIHVRQACHPSGKACRTEFHVKMRVESRGGLPPRDSTLIECAPHTGRMHQIRVHLAHLGFPILGDKIYGPDERCYLEHMESGWTEHLAQKLHLSRHALHASGLCFPHPMSGEPMHIECALPPEMASFIS